MKCDEQKKYIAHFCVIKLMFFVLLRVLFLRVTERNPRNIRSLINSVVSIFTSELEDNKGKEVLDNDDVVGQFAFNRFIYILN